MKHSALKNLVCPATLGPLHLDACKLDAEGEISEGFLRSEEGREYPVINGVPRLLPLSLLRTLTADYPEFFKRYGRRPLQRISDLEGVDKLKRRTQTSSGWEWNHAADYNADNLQQWLPSGMRAQQLFSRQIGLEVGCGAGRHSETISAYAEQHFAVDISSAVDAAYQRNRHKPNCHVVQADVYHLPFSPGGFDYVLGLGLIQHLPDAQAAFAALAQQTRADGMLLVNVDQDSRPVSQAMLSLVRSVSTHLPLPLLSPVAQMFALLDYSLLIAPWQLLARGMPRSLIEKLAPARSLEYSRHDFHTMSTDWFERLSNPVRQQFEREDLEHWFREQGFGEISVTPYWQALWNGAGRRRLSY